MAHIDQTVIEQLRADMGSMADEILLDLVDSLQRDANRQLGELQAALDTQDAARFRMAAHGLKGSSASLGAVELAAHCLEMENRGKAGDLSDGAGQLAAARQLASDSIAALQALLG